MIAYFMIAKDRERRDMGEWAGMMRAAFHADKKGWKKLMKDLMKDG